MKRARKRSIVEKIVGTCSNPTHSKYVHKEVHLSTFEYKGCWACRWFSRKEGAYMTVKEASKKYDVSETTIRSWCRSGKLRAYLCKKRRYTGNLFQGPPKIWIIFGKNGLKKN